MRDLLLIVHVLAAAAWIGGGLTTGFLTARVQGDRALLAGFMRAYEAMGRVYFNVAGIVTLLAGIWLVIDGLYDFEDLFVGVGVVVVVVGALLGARVFTPLSREIATAAEAGDEAAVEHSLRRFRTVGMVDSGLLVLAVVAMVAKWGA